LVGVVTPVEKASKPVRIWPVYKEDYGHHYGAIHYKGKKVLDIGADVGSTADFFLRRGAREVIAVDGSKNMYRELVKNTKKIPEIKPILLKIEKPQHFEQLIRKFRPDVLKSDCEGCEKHLFKIPDEVFSMVKEYMVETHGSGTFKAMFEKCKRCKFTILNVVAWRKGIDIIYAKRA